MIYKKSCGFVAYKEIENERLYLIVRTSNGEYGFPKGHVENNETEHETAIREIREETALCVEFVDHFREVITYSPKPECMKDVVFFLARMSGGELTCQPEEVQEAWFAPYDEAIQSITHASDCEVLKKAEQFLNCGN